MKVSTFGSQKHPTSIPKEVFTINKSSPAFRRGLLGALTSGLMLR